MSMLLTGVFATDLMAAPFDSSAFRKILTDHRRIVHRDGVDFAGIRYHDAELRKLSEQALADVQRYTGQTEAEWKAFYINAYNIAVIHTMVHAWPVSSILNLEQGKVFRNPRLSIRGRQISLDELEKGFLKPGSDPRVHFALVCAAIGCPDLRAELYMPDKLNTQLDDQARQYLHSVRGALLQGQTLHLSKLFEWYATDFGDLRMYVSRYRTFPGSVKIVTDIEYNWGANHSP